MSDRWQMLNIPDRPLEGDVVNVWASSIIDGKYKQFLATYTSYKACGKKKDVWTPLGGQWIFNEETVMAWRDRLSGPGWTYNTNGD